MTEYTFRAQMADRWRRGNIFLLGDAAHLTPPFIGQGMGAGLRDAMNLAWKLAGVIAGDLPVAVLDSYEQERKPHTRHMIRLALGVGWAMTAGGRFGNLIRRLVVTRMHVRPGTAKQGHSTVERRPCTARRSSTDRARHDSWPGRCAPIPCSPTGRDSTTSSAMASRSSPSGRQPTRSAQCSTSAAPSSTSPTAE